MKRIALTGIPGSGKSALADALVDHYHDYRPVWIIDNYAPVASARIDLAHGFEGSYVSNVYIALERLACERKAPSSSGAVITCGTLIETSTYMAMEFESRQQFWNEEERADNNKRIRAGMTMTACLYMDSFHYDKVYYLPPFAESDDQRLAVMDRNLQAAFQAFWLTPTIPLMAEGDSLEEVTAARLELIKKEESEVPNQERAGTTSASSE